MFTFYGDVASNHQGYHPTVSKLGYDISISNPLTDYLDIKFYGMMGTIGANERSLTRNLNFQSDITTGGFIINYNFGHILKKDHFVNPYLGVGFESIEFLSKTDLYDANGNYYHYWSDGSIRDIAENSPLAASANFIYRDYTYETDLRLFFAKYGFCKRIPPNGRSAQHKQSFQKDQILKTNSPEGEVCTAQKSF